VEPSKLELDSKSTQDDKALSPRLPTQQHDLPSSAEFQEDGISPPKSVEVPLTKDTSFPTDVSASKDTSATKDINASKDAGASKGTPELGVASPKGTHADLKSTETDQADLSVFNKLPTAVEMPDSKSDVTTAHLANGIAEMSIKPMHHRRTSSLTTISEVSKSSTPASAIRSLPNAPIVPRAKNCEHALCVEDPFRPTENVAMNTSRAALRRIQEVLEIARTALLAHAPLRQIFVVANTEDKLPQLEEA
jgi:hypothetical protein